ncbi:hypothetical protein [Modicisalibacter tunisiensis]|uniref:Uncharacterized protein n=1 Tax=Modicisalibacter tunisiensis TaxID=390637 RepID=A0ABS7X2Z2_9GAMM|nr:hypothetical protein [Modicisalibacter tunisiensis]MBZ9540506.1 hypothetical protein [Modicisalibacter tunisiensis]MBZ9569260.1 hypothetical protein [Modicisalibacter tunisiensis]
MTSTDRAPGAAMREDNLTTTRANWSTTMTTKYAPKPMMDADTAMDRLEAARADYLEKRQALEKEHGELQELRSILASHRKQTEAAHQQAEAAIRAAKGHETEESIGLQEMVIRKERQIRVVESMVAAQEPAVELLQIDAYGARITYTHQLELARQSVAFGEIQERAADLFETEAAAPLMRLLPSLMARVEDAIYRDEVYMATHGVRPAPSGGPAKLVKAWLGRDAQKDVEEKVRKEQMAAIGEIVAQFISEPKGDELEGFSEILSLIEPMSCEASGSKWDNSGITIARRRRELVAQVGEQAA